MAEHNAAEAERMLDLLELPNLRFVYGLAVLHRMAAIDPARAARLARGYPYASQQGYALGIVAHRLADTDSAAASSLLDEAYTTLEHAPPAIQVYDRRETAATRAAGLLPVAEKIDRRLVESYFWRTLVQSLPDAPVKPALNPKQSAARLVADWLGYSPRELWRVVYNRCTPRDPDARDEER